ncbi:DUF4232 domain-containing protein [Streptomyces sp. TRM76130]|nr:DUF4232 domain-containing protein [Streptomyces sp. TRM76130]
MSARTTRVRLFAAATVALAAVSLTACQDGSATGLRTTSASSDATADTTARTGADGTASDDTDTTATGTGTGEQSSTATRTTTGSRGTTDDGADASIPGDCSADDVRITAAEVSSPINHLLLTATNTGSRVCALPPYPVARFGEAQSVPPVMKSSQPQSLTMLEPGGSGYAGVLLSAADGSAAGGRTETTLTIPFDDGSIATVALPAAGVHIDDSLSLTYWLTDRATALTY